MVKTAELICCGNCQTCSLTPPNPKFKINDLVMFNNKACCGYGSKGIIFKVDYCVKRGNINWVRFEKDGFTSYPLSAGVEIEMGFPDEKLDLQGRTTTLKEWTTAR